MVSPDEALAVVLEVIQILDELGVPYALGGSLASSMYGVPRLTQDADLVADLRAEHVRPFIQKAANLFYLSPERMAHAVTRRSSFNLIHSKTALKVDIFVLKPDPLSREEMTRRRVLPLPDEPQTRLQVASPEDVVLQKLLWFRMGNGISDRQWSDILGVLKIQRTGLDFNYLKKWATREGVEDLLKRAYEDAGISYPP